VTTKIPCCPYHGSDCLANQSASTVPAEFDEDLTQLGLEQVDLMLLHWPCKTLEQTVATYKQMEAMLAQNKARAIGVSNFNADFMKRFLASDIKVKPAVNQCGYSIGAHNRSEDGQDDATRSYCQSQGVAYQAYSPLGGLSGVDVLGDKDVNAIAAAHNASAAQVALRWVAQQGALFVTAGSKAEYLREDLDIYGFELSATEMALLSSK
jgi:diketogulonate reductase-like aldo/keto reductase